MSVTGTGSAGRNGSGNGGATRGSGAATTTTATLTTQQAADLVAMVEEEKLAGDVYATLAAQYGDAELARIATSEDKHAASLRTLLTRITYLQKISLFAAVPTWHLLPIAEACHEATFREQAPIFLQGEPGDSLCILLAGNVEVVRDGAVINRLGPGEVCGEVSVLGLAPRTAGVFAVGEVLTLMLEAERFRKIVRENGDIGLAVIQVLAERLRVATERESALRSLTGTILRQRVDGPLP